MIVSLPVLALIHAVLSIIGIIAGLVLVGGLMSRRRLDSWLGVFLATTFLTNATGFGSPFVTLLPSHIVGAISLVILPVTIAVRYWKHLAGGWRQIFVVTTMVTLYFNVFVLVVQLFQKFPLLIAVAPTQKTPAFVVTQLLVLALFMGVGRASVPGFRTAQMAGAV